MASGYRREREEGRGNEGDRKGGRKKGSRERVSRQGTSCSVQFHRNNRQDRDNEETAVANHRTPRVPPLDTLFPRQPGIMIRLFMRDHYRLVEKKVSLPLSLWKASDNAYCSEKKEGLYRGIKRTRFQATFTSSDSRSTDIRFYDLFRFKYFSNRMPDSNFACSIFTGSNPGSFGF